LARSFGEPLTKLRTVWIEDNGEPLLDPRTLSKRIHFAEQHPRFDMKRMCVVRRTVAEMLARAAEALPDGISLEIMEGLRPILKQRAMYESIRGEFQKKHPEWNTSTLNRITNTMSAPPDDKCPPPHTTGGAVDVTLIDATSLEWLDLISPFPPDETCAPTNLAGLTEPAAKNRTLLIETLSASGLTNYAGEWWHWSFGDSGWALRTGAPKAIYGRLPEAACPRL
jgi:D-alanyl-D-alanine dipeptidase